MQPFYGRRHGRKLCNAAAKTLQDLLTLVQILPGTDLINPVKLFNNDKHIYMEIGFGMGDHLAGVAKNRQGDINFIGCEPFINGVHALLKKYGFLELDLDQLKIYLDDARQLIARLNDESIDKLFILFPDPWPKAKHNKRRLINDSSIKEFARILKPGGVLRIATDDTDYVEWILNTTDKVQNALSPNFNRSNCTLNYNEIITRPSDWQPTKYEQKALKLGKNCHYMDFSRLS